MAIIMMISVYPQHLAQEVITATMSTKLTYPASLKKTQDWAVGATTRKYKVYTVYECPDKDLSECLIFLAKRYNKIAAKAPGYTFKVELLMNKEDAIKTLM